jgi:hypothetical protein
MNGFYTQPVGKKKVPVQLTPHVSPAVGCWRLTGHTGNFLMQQPVAGRIGAGGM